jgi:hypothetical protein
LLPIAPDVVVSAETEALRRAIVGQFEQYVKLNKKIPPAKPHGIFKRLVHFPIETSKGTT